MSDSQPFALLVLAVAGLGLAAVLSSHLAARVRIPAPALFLVAAALAVKVVPAVHTPSEATVERVIGIALVFILFDGGMRVGWPSFRASVAPITTLGLIGTFLTVVVVTVLVHLALGPGWFISALVATAVAPTDPAVVFSVLGRRRPAGNSGTILEGESGVNDPVGIALMAGLLGAGALSTAASARIGELFVEQMGIGGVIGIVGGTALLWFMRRVPLPSEGLYPLRTAAGALVLFALASLAHGSGFLAVFVAGIVVGEERAPFKAEIERFHSALASLAEIVAFAVLGLTVDLSQIGRTDVWVPGLALGVVLSFVIRPVLIALCLLPARMPRNQRNFVLGSGLKGVVPMLLGSELLEAHVAGAERWYGVVVVVVVFSVIVQGSLLPTFARLLGLPMHTVELEPWSLGVRLSRQPSGVFNLMVSAGSPADGCSIEGLRELPVDSWIGLVVRQGQLVRARGSTTLRAGDQVLVQAGPEAGPRLAGIFGRFSR